MYASGIHLEVIVHWKCVHPIVSQLSDDSTLGTRDLIITCVSVCVWGGGGGWGGGARDRCEGVWGVCV